MIGGRVEAPESIHLVSARRGITRGLLERIAASAGCQIHAGPNDSGTRSFGDAQVELRTGSGGVVSLHGNRSIAMKRADVLMAQHCGDGAFTIVREGEEVSESEAVTTQWRVHYECNRR